MNPEILDLLDEIKEELKRADHLLFVSLKYTRTVDVILNVLGRMINVYAKGIDTLLELGLYHKRISQIPVAVNLKAKTVIQAFPSKELENHVYFFLMLRQMTHLPHERREEYKRHVAMILLMEDSTITEIGSDELFEFFKRTAEFIMLLEEFVYHHD